MHLVIGGACNGKNAWVRRTYDLRGDDDVKWIKAYESPFTNAVLEAVDSTIVVMEGIDHWIKELSLELPSDQLRELWKDHLSRWERWEKECTGRLVVLIGTDITRGIVPMERTDRKWRDDVGWAFQDTVKLCNRVEQIWYGIPQRLK